MAIHLHLLSVTTPSNTPTKDTVKQTLSFVGEKYLQMLDFQIALFSGDVHRAERCDKADAMHANGLPVAYTFTHSDIASLADGVSTLSAIDAWITNYIAPSGALGRNEFILTQSA